MEAHMIWFIATALMVTAVLVLGTAASAGYLRRRQQPEPVRVEAREHEGERERQAA